MSKLEGTDSKPRNQILETPKNSEASEKKSSEADDSKSRNQILETPGGNDSSEKDEKIDKKDDNEGTKSGSDKDKRPIRERVSDFFKKFKENDDKKKTSETDNKQESKKEVSEDKQPEFSQRDETKTNDVPDKKNNNETGNTSDDTGHAETPNSELSRDSVGRNNPGYEISKNKSKQIEKDDDMER